MKLIKKKYINLGYKGLSDNDLDDVLCHVIKESSVLYELGLHDNNITLADGKLANAIAKNTTLKRLHLNSNSNNIGTKGVKQLANALKRTIYFRN